MTSKQNIERIAAVLSPGQEAYMVGGFVRDMVLGRDTCDIDLTVQGDVGALAAAIARQTGGTAFVMDAEREVYRVAVKGACPAQYDLTPLKGGIEDDLAARDFTVNAMAVRIPQYPPSPSSPPLKGGETLLSSPLAGEGRVGALLPSPLEGGGPGWGCIDPFGGLKDIGTRVIRAVSKDVFTSDPLRMLRAFRLANQLGFIIEAETLSLVKRDAPLIGSVSPERVLDELYIILSGPGAAGSFLSMHGAGLLQEVLPETSPMEGLLQGEPHAHDLFTHSMKAMEYAEKVIEDSDRFFGRRAEEIKGFLDTEMPGGLRMSGLVKLAALLHDTGKPSSMRYEGKKVRFTGHDMAGGVINETIAARLKMSSKVAEGLKILTEGHMRPLHLSRREATRHAVYRYVRDMGEFLPASLIVALADAFATRERPEVMPTDVEGVVRDIADYYFGEYKKAKAEPLINGGDLIGMFGLVPGPVFREILGDVEEKRAVGAINSRDEAIVYVRKNFL